MTTATAQRSGGPAETVDWRMPLMVNARERFAPLIGARAQEIAVLDIARAACVRAWSASLAAATVALLLVVDLAIAADGAADARLAPGSGRFDYTFVSAGAPRNIPVWYHRPPGAGADPPIVFVLHGQGRTAQNYRSHWIPFAEKQRFVLLVPEFSRAEFPGNRSYNLGNMAAEDGTPYPESQWSYTAIENLFDLVRTANHFSKAQYDLYGHSAGGQFVHRLVMFKPGARFRVAVAANSGWYTMPDRAVEFPYGLGSSGVSSAQLAQALSRHAIVLLGDADTDPDHPALSRTPGALEQGPHRFARGHAFFERARRAAAQLGIPLAWSLEIAPGVAHSNAGMAPHAARFVGGGGERGLLLDANVVANAVDAVHAAGGRGCMARLICGGDESAQLDLALVAVHIDVGRGRRADVGRNGSLDLGGQCGVAGEFARTAPRAVVRSTCG